MKGKTDGRDERIGAAIRAARERRNMGQLDLGNAIGVSKVMISRLEAGSYRLKVSTLLDIATALRVPVGRLLRQGEIRR